MYIGNGSLVIIIQWSLQDTPFPSSSRLQVSHGTFTSAPSRGRHSCRVIGTSCLPPKKTEGRGHKSWIFVARDIPLEIGMASTVIFNFYLSLKLLHYFFPGELQGLVALFLWRVGAFQLFLANSNDFFPSIKANQCNCTVSAVKWFYTQAFSGEVEEGVSSERRHFKLNRFSWEANPSNYLKLRKPWQDCAFASSLSGRQRQTKATIKLENITWLLLQTTNSA